MAIKYLLTDNDSGHFSIDTDTGQVKVAGSLSGVTGSRDITVRAYVDTTFPIEVTGEAGGDTTATAFNTTRIQGTSSDVVFSNTNKTITGQNGNDWVVSVGSAITGKKCFAVSIDTYANWIFLGVANAGDTAAGDTTAFDPTNPWGAFNISGKHVMLAIDYDAAVMLLTTNGTDWYNGDFNAYTTAQVAAGTAPGKSISANKAAGPIFAAVHAPYHGVNATAGQVVTLLDTLPWAMPSGYAQV